jgi:hypothetical protein
LITKSEIQNNDNFCQTKLHLTALIKVEDVVSKSLALHHRCRFINSVNYTSTKNTIKHLFKHFGVTRQSFIKKST